jgi:hypothetical protein
MELNIHITRMGPPISFMIGGKQYITATRAPGGGSGAG